MVNILKSSVCDGAGDLPAIPIEPVDSYCIERPRVSHHREKAGSIDAYFTFHEEIGEGGFSTVRRAVLKATGETYAVKIIDKLKMKNGEFSRVIFEINTLASVHHPRICKLQSVFYTRNKIFMVMEYCYTDLFEYLVKLDEPMPEPEGGRIFVQLLSAISYLHRRGIAHRDIKPENILLTQNGEIRLSDFGLASALRRNSNGMEQFLCTYCGSVAYCAPEIISGIPYCGEKADIWSLGVNLYVLLANELPFGGKTPSEVKARIINCRFHAQPHLSKRSLSLIKKILQVEPGERPSLREIWEDPWIQAVRLDVSDLILEEPSDSEEDVQQLGQETNVVASRCRELSDPLVYWCHKPVTVYEFEIYRNTPVQIDTPVRQSRARRLLQFTRKNLRRFKKLIFCR